jgi:NCS1 family nucleobase:cation symporter-1
VSQSDFSRFARRPKDQVFGQWFSFIFIGTIMPFFGCLVSSATQQIYGQPIWNPPVLILTWLQTDYNSKARAAAVFAGIGIGISQMAVIVVDNAYSVGIDLSGLFPKYINVRRGAYVGLVLSMAMCPWELMTTAAVFLTVISSFTVFFGPICGIHICDYWVLRRRRIKLSDLYHAQETGIYYYWRGVNWRAFVSWFCGWVPLLPGLIHLVTPSIQVSVGATRLYSLSFVIGLCMSFVVHLALNTIFPPPGLQDFDEVDNFGTFTPEEAQKLGVAIPEDADSSSGMEGSVEAKV